ncbi:hypothetical protein [Natrinema caseinilyticum]|uniref:hypothetical protein n=1 Tax=Natrinema caseinilyticum TaxID=2961570 RepID=UPI0020C2B78E|nr:hypothetical protein [Natrinema caseinilyticum]
MGERYDAESETSTRGGAAVATDRVRHLVSRLSDGDVVQFARGLWRRYVREDPADCRVSITFPTGPDRPTVGRIHDWIADLEVAFEGRVDVYARRRSIAVVTDTVPADRVDVDAVESIIERIEAGYAETHSLAHLEKVRPRNGRLVRTDVVVPVKPLFPRDRATEPKRVRSAAD